MEALPRYYLPDEQCRGVSTSFVGKENLMQTSPAVFPGESRDLVATYS